MTPQDLFGNIIADGLAVRAATLYQVWTQDSFTVKWYYSLVRKVQARAVAILIDCLEPRKSFTPAARLPKPKRLSNTAHAMQSQHQVAIMGSTLQCCRCNQHSPPGDKAIKRWLATPCAPDRAMSQVMRFAATRPTAVPQGTVITVGRSTIHGDHSLSLYKGLYFCKKCGYHASSKAQKLRHDCTGMSSKAAKDRVLSLLRGELPSGLLRWPNERQAELEVLCLNP